MHRWLEHTGEAELEIAAGSEREVFAEALAGLAELLGGARPDGPVQTHRLTVEAGERAALLVGWLEELLWLAEREGVVPEAVEAIELGPDSLTASVLARPGPPSPLVKAVTWHDLNFEPSADGYRARVVFDV